MRLPPRPLPRLLPRAGGGLRATGIAFPPEIPAFAGNLCAALLTGPEGGFDESERAAIRALPQAQAITLGPRILRGETAAIAATALWMGTVGDWTAPAKNCWRSAILRTNSAP